MARGYRYDFENSSCISIPGFVPSTELCTHRYGPNGSSEKIHSAFRPRWSQIRPRKKGEEKPKNFTITWTICMRIHYFVVHRVFYNFGINLAIFWIFYPFDIEICRTSPLDLTSVQSDCGKITKKVPKIIHITRRIRMRLQKLFLLLNCWVCAVNWSIYTSMYT